MLLLILTPPQPLQRAGLFLAHGVRNPAWQPKRNPPEDARPPDPSQTIRRQLHDGGRQQVEGLH